MLDNVATTTAFTESQCSDAAGLPEDLSEVKVNEPTCTRVHSNEPLALLSSSSEEPVAGPSGRMQELVSDDPLAISSEEPNAGPNATSSVNESTSDIANLVMPDFTFEFNGIQSAPSGSSGKRVRCSTDEIRSMWTWKKIFMRLGTKEQCVQFAEERGMVPVEKMCTYHHKPMTKNFGASQFRVFSCRKGKCRNRKYSQTLGTWFENMHLPLTTLFPLIYAFSEGESYAWVQKQLSEENKPVLSNKTIIDWYRYCRETVVIYVMEHSTHESKIGGPNKIVQIEQSQFSKRKYTKGKQHIEEHWAIGMIEDGSEDLRLEVCPNNDRSAEVLVPIIKKHVQEGSIIHTDCWEAYQCLPEHGYIHKTVDHNDPNNKFVSPDGTHTQRIHSQWRVLKNLFRQQLVRADFGDWLAEYTWRRNIKVNHKDPFEELIKTILYVYNVNKKREK